MSFLGRLFGIGGFEGHVEDADRAFAAGRFGEAKLAYERALAASSGAAADAVARARARATECADAIAEERLREAERLLAADEDELGREELEHALGTAVSDGLVDRIKKRITALEAREAREAARDDAPVTDEERLAALAGGWDEAQADEYGTYGAAFDRALLALQKEAFADGRALLEEVLAGAPSPVYLHLEIGKARILAGDVAGGEDALRTFLSKIPAEEGAVARVEAHGALAQILDERGLEEEAIGELQAAIDAFPEHPAPFFSMGRYLRVKGHAEEAIDVLRAAADVAGDLRPDWRIFQELGLAQRDAGLTEEAVETLEGVVESFVQRADLRGLPPDAAVALAKLYEATDKPERAADLYRTLAAGFDKVNHARYYVEAARLLMDLDLEAEAGRLLDRASALSPDPATAAKIEALRRGDPGATARDADGGRREGSD